MNVIVYGCFHLVGFHFMEQLLYEEVDVYATDQLDHPDKEFLYELVGRNAFFHFVDEGQLKEIEASEVFHFYEDNRCILQKGKKKTEIIFHDINIISPYKTENRDKSEYEKDLDVHSIVQWLLNLRKCSILSDKYVINSQDVGGIHFINY